MVSWSGSKHLVRPLALQSFFWTVMPIALIHTIRALLLINALAPTRLLSSTHCRPKFANGLFQKYPLAFGRIKDDSSKRTSLKEGINHCLINQNFNKRENNGDNKNGNRDFVSAHDLLSSSTNVNDPRNDVTALPLSDNTSPSLFSETSNLAPLKVMLFIDGTWLYYSIYERDFDRDVISQKLGKEWKIESTPDWSSLPMVACQGLLKDPKSKWSAIMPVGIDDSNDMESTTASKQPPVRPIEVARVSVYSSMHRDTPKDSLRYKMFADMIKAGFDVNMMETIGKGEKCVDIQLAVDMLYYATVPDAYDVALLLTGDRDFLPAVIRCRQKGRRIGLVSMRTGSLAFEVTPNLKDYDTIWMEDYLSEWIRKKTPEELKSSSVLRKRSFSTASKTRQTSSQISPYILNRVITNFIKKSGEPQVSSRDIGRHLKALSVNGNPMLDDIKAVYGGLYQFLIVSEIYDVIADSRRAVKAFWVALHTDENGFQEEDPVQKETLSDDENKFLAQYNEWVPVNKNKEYDFTMNEPDQLLQQSNSTLETYESSFKLEGSSSTVDYNALTIPELKTICREKGLKVSAQKKVELVERIEAHLKENLQHENADAEISPERYLKALVLEYLQASGGQASSRDVGRYLAANKTSYRRRSRHESGGPPVSALSELKEIYGSLINFVKRMPNFYFVSAPGHEFNICIHREKHGQKPQSDLREKKSTCD
mmetsp:Transcript_14112/g.32837  ORF Transcript_14112/g.32837 Transcript_14112/m.32837 type:complete len:711 (+) Transcript_14112:41-2173(+)